jgi:uncharacterized protein
MPETQVTALNYYPIKSCAATIVEEMAFTERGPQFDREWMLVNEHGKFITQRNRPEMALIQPTVDPTGRGILTVDAPDMETLQVLPDEAGHEQPVEFWKKAGTGVTQGEKASEWFSTFLGRKVELLRVKEPRPVKPECRIDGAAQAIGFADGFPMLLASEGSLNKLNHHLDNPIPMNRFRPNIVVGTKTPNKLRPYDEDYWRELAIGDLTAFVVRACERCPIPETNQLTGERLAPKGEVTAALEDTRHGVDPVSNTAGNFFGQNLVHVFEPGVTIKLGDTVRVESRAAERNIIF